MNDPRAVGPQIRFRVPSLMTVAGKVTAEIPDCCDIAPDSTLCKAVEGAGVSGAARNSSRLGGAATARIAQRGLGAALFEATAQRARKNADANLARRMRAVHLMRRG